MWLGSVRSKFYFGQIYMCFDPTLLVYKLAYLLFNPSGFDFMAQNIKLSIVILVLTYAILTNITCFDKKIYNFRFQSSPREMALVT